MNILLTNLLAKHKQEVIMCYEMVAYLDKSEALNVYRTHKTGQPGLLDSKHSFLQESCYKTRLSAGQL